MITLDDYISKTRAGRNKKFKLGLLLLNLSVAQLIICIETSLSFRLAGFWCHADPFQFVLQSFFAFGFRFLFLLEPLCFLFKP